MGYRHTENEIIPIKLLDFNTETGSIELLHVIRNYRELRFVDDFAGVGSFTIEINADIERANELTVGRYIQIGNETLRQGVIMAVSRSLSTDDSGNVSNNLVVSGTQLKGLFSYSLTMPEGGLYGDDSDVPLFDEIDTEGRQVVMGGLTYLGVGSSHDVYEDMRTEDIMRELVKVNKFQNILPFQNMPNLELEPEPVEFRGIMHDREEFRFKPLSEALQYLAETANLGWYIVIEGDKFVFKIIEGVDRSVEQSEINPAVFSFNRGNIRRIDYDEDTFEMKNQLVVAGAGEGEARELLVVGDLDDPTKTGINSRLGFVDARDVRSLVGLITRARNVIAKNRRRQSIGVQGFSKKSLLRLGEDYNVGDTVTIKVEEWGITLSVQIMSITERQTMNNAGTLEFEFGTKGLTLESLMQRNFNELNNERLI